jgi:hypothetical protein
VAYATFERERPDALLVGGRHGSGTGDGTIGSSASKRAFQASQSAFTLRHTRLTVGEFRKIVQVVQQGEREARQAKKEMVEANLRLSSSRSPRNTSTAAPRSSRRRSAVATQRAARPGM